MFWDININFKKISQCPSNLPHLKIKLESNEELGREVNKALTLLIN